MACFPTFWNELAPPVPSAEPQNWNCYAVRELVGFAHVGDVPGRSTAREAQPFHPGPPYT
eukprot:3627613-Pleurochrysis_carterae.AAC.1